MEVILQEHPGPMQLSMSNRQMADRNASGTSTDKRRAQSVSLLEADPAHVTTETTDCLERLTKRVNCVMI